MSSAIKKRYAKDEYELQHFQSSSSDFLFQFRGMVEKLVDVNLQEFEETVVKKLKMNDSERKIFQEELLTLGNIVKTRIGEFLETQEFQEKVYGLFEVPENILLPDDHIHYENFGDDSIESLTKEIEDLEKQYKKDLLLMHLYDQEIALSNELAPIQNTFTDTMDKVKNLPTISKLRKNFEISSNKLSFNKEMKNAYTELVGLSNYVQYCENVLQTTKNCVLGELEEY